jgi:hypothetical protein
MLLLLKVQVFRLNLKKINENQLGTIYTKQNALVELNDSTNSLLDSLPVMLDDEKMSLGSMITLKI